MKLTATLALLGTMVPFLVQADQSTHMFDQGEPVKENVMQGERESKNQLPAGYNQAACCTTNDSFEAYLSGSFLYWTAQQEALSPGVAESASGSELTSLFQKGGYKPAFKGSFGFDMKGMDYWNFVAEFTWYKSTNTLSASAGTGDIYTAINGDSFDTTYFASALSSEWKLTVEILDAALQRPFYSGRKLTANISCGLRALRIKQNTTESFSDAEVEVHSTPVYIGAVSEVNKSKMWGIGPRLEFDANWLFGAGFRFSGKFANSLLFASYTSLSGKSDFNVDGITSHETPNGNYNTVRAVTEAGLGFGWGTYSWDNTFHFDLYAGYDFNAFWNQNTLNQLALGYAAPGNLYLHGLTVTARFDF